MLVKEYQRLSTRTLPKTFSQQELLINMALGIFGEGGEVVDLIKKHVYQGHDLDSDKIEEELGDLLWYLSNMATISGLDLEGIMERNVDKLRRRYPSGFEVFKSTNREV